MHPPLPPFAGLIRMIDANLNRAAEALRVGDDLARFVLDDAKLAGEMKALRHGLVEAARAFDPGLRLAHRDTAGDVGTGLAGATEYARTGAGSIAVAAGGRAAEALRSIEEASKALPQASVAVRAVEQLRYRSYDAFAALTLRLGGGREGRQWALCVLITESLCTHHRWDRVAELAVEGGADCLQLREKTMESGELLARATRLVEIAHAAGRGGPRPSVIVNDRPDIAVLAGADGVHVGQSDLPVAAVRKLAGFTVAVGVSTANLDHARRAASDGADYVGLGPMFVSSTKPKPSLSGVDYLRAFLADPAVSRLPHLAISGISPANAGDLAAAGCRGIAVSSVVCGAADPRRVCEDLRDAVRHTIVT